MHMCDCSFCEWCGDDHAEEKYRTERAFIDAALLYAAWSWRDEGDESLKDVGRKFFAAADAMLAARLLP